MPSSWREQDTNWMVKIGLSPSTAHQHGKCGVALAEHHWDGNLKQDVSVFQRKGRLVCSSVCAQRETAIAWGLPKKDAFFLLWSACHVFPSRQSHPSLCCWWMARTKDKTSLFVFLALLAFLFLWSYAPNSPMMGLAPLVVPTNVGWPNFVIFHERQIVSQRQSNSFTFEPMHPSLIFFREACIDVTTTGAGSMGMHDLLGAMKKPRNLHSWDS